MVVQTQIKINGNDVTSYLVNYEFEKSYQDVIGNVSIKLIKTVVNAFNFAEGDLVEIWRGYTTPTDLKIFAGYIEKYEPEGGSLSITAKDKLWDLVRKEATQVYDYQIDPFAGKISAIFTDLVTTYGGLNADGASVQDSGTTTILKKFVCNHADPFERCQALANCLDWQFYYRADTDKVYFEPKGMAVNTNVLEVGRNVVKVPKWSYDITEMCNDLTIRGARQEVSTTEKGQIGVTANYTVNSVLLGNVPMTTTVWWDVNVDPELNPLLSPKIGGVPDSTVIYDYFVDKNQKTIYPATGTTFPNNDYFTATYSLMIPIPVHLTNLASQTDYGQFKKTITYSDIRTINDATVKGKKYIDVYSTPFLYTTVQVNTVTDLSLSVGQLIQVMDNVSSPVVDKGLMITRIRYRYPNDYTELDVGDKIWRLAGWQGSVEERLKRLEEEADENSDMVIEVLDIDNSINSPIKMWNRYTKIQTQTAAQPIFILGNPLHGILGSSHLGGALTSPADYAIVQGKNSYSEDFRDNDFKDGVTTADWNNAGKYCQFDPNEIAQSTSIDYNNGTITTAKMTVLAPAGGDYEFYMSANGGANWELVSTDETAINLGVIYNFTNTGTDLRWKIKYVDIGVGTITDVTIDNYH
jgi:hypothetical protein